MKQVILLFSFIFIAIILTASPVSQDSVLTTATNWLEVQSMHSCSVDTFAVIVNNVGIRLLYKIDFNPSGFVIITADDCTYPILGYSPNGHICNVDFPAFNELLDSYTNAISTIIAQNYTNEATLPEWLAINSRTITETGSVIIAMDPTWDQISPYNQDCPAFEHQHSYTGCGATAMSQIINYHKVYNYQFSDADDYVSTFGETVNIDNDASNPDFAFPNFTQLNTLMQNVENKFHSFISLNDSDKAALSFADGVLMTTGYSIFASASTTSGIQSAYNKLHYHNYYVERNQFSDVDWLSLITHDIDKNRPIQYFGYDQYVGHTFLVCGYDSDMKLFINWGWGGSADGFFELNDLHPGYNFSTDQEMICNIYPISKINQQVLISNLSFPLSQNIRMKIIDSENNEQLFLSNTNGFFSCDIGQPGVYDVIIQYSPNSDNYEWYEKYNLNLIGGVNNLESGPITLNYNPDKTINVPLDYSDLQYAIDRIQNNGTVIVQNGYQYSGTPVHWKYKHLHLLANSTGVGFPICLDWSGINNTDWIQGLDFNGCSGWTDHGPAMQLLNGASPSVTLCNFNNNLVSCNYSLDYPSGKGVGGAVFIEGVDNQVNYPVFTNCNFTENRVINANGGGAVALYGRVKFITCNFTNNRADANVGIGYPSTHNAGGAIIVYTTDKTGDILFDRCHFINNKGKSEAQDVYIANCDNMNQIKFMGCTFNWAEPFYFNHLPAIKILPNSGIIASQHASLLVVDNKFITLDGGALEFNDYSGKIALTFSRNIIDNNQDYGNMGFGVYLRYHGSAPINPLYLTFNNNTFRNIHGSGLVLFEGATYTIKNTIFDNCSQFGISWGQYETGHSNWATAGLTLNNCFFDAAHQISYVDVVSSPGHTLAANSLIFAVSPDLDANYNPLWNTTVKSVCIDNGEPGRPDADSTPADIGAKTAIAHNYEQYAMWNDKSPDKINQGLKWMCFPVLDHYMTSNNINVNFFDNILHQSILEWIQYKPLHVNQPNIIQWSTQHQNWGDCENEVVSSIQGYKVKLLNTVEDQIWINTSGLLQSPQSVIDLQGDHDVHADNWIGYFCKDSADPLKALEAIIDNLDEIKTQYWCLTKQGDGSWIGEKNAVLNYGDMVILHGHTDCSFQWNNSEPVPPHDKKFPKEFIYTEKENYIPVYIRLYGSKSDEVPSEIGLYVNDVCKGAVAVKDSLAQICAYIDDDEEITPENSQLVFYYESKSTGNNMGIYHMNDKSFTYINGNTPYYVVSISDFNNVIPVVTETALSQNYPNPFNPSTTISYQIPKDGKVNLVIYNIRGQMVKCLVNTNQAMGIHRIVWDGKDENRKSCASGVYYYRLNTSDKTETKKMLLLK